MIAVGIDVHKRKCTVAVQSEDGELRMLPSIENTRGDWLQLLGQFPPGAEIALEVSRSGGASLAGETDGAGGHARESGPVGPSAHVLAAGGGSKRVSLDAGHQEHSRGRSPALPFRVRTWEGQRLHTTGLGRVMLSISGPQFFVPWMSGRSGSRGGSPT
jgi:hypothetical protein